MAIKKWSTGSIGNDSPIRINEENENSLGLDSNNRPGVEGYIEEDKVIANIDNRPLRNLVNNDIQLENNSSDIASEVDRGVFLDRYEDFELEILPVDLAPNPEFPDENINISTLRVKSGSSIINGSVTRIGNQKIIYFVRKDDEDSILFPPYSENENELQIEITDPDYWGKYEPVYSTESDDLPNDFDNYTLRIINIDQITEAPDIPLENKYSVFNMYRDWEDIVPIEPESSSIENEIIQFNHDRNYGQFSEGYRLDSSGVMGTQVSNVDIRKNIVVKDSLFNYDDFNVDGMTWKSDIVIDGLFFDDVQLLGEENIFNRNIDLQDLFIDSLNNLFFITRDKNSKYIYYLSDSALRLQSKSLNIDTGNPTNLFAIDNYLFITGTKGTSIGDEGYIEILDLSSDFISTSLIQVPGLSVTQDITFITEFDDKIWISGESSLFYADKEGFDPTAVGNFTEIDLNLVVLDSASNTIIDYITTLNPVKGNTLINSSLEHTIVNLISNSSFEQGGINNLPTDWTVNDDASGSLVVNSNGKFGNYKSVLTRTSEIAELSADQLYEIDLNSSGDNYLLSVYLKSISNDSSTIYIEELDSNDIVTSDSRSSITLVANDDWARNSVLHSIISDETVKLRIRIGIGTYTPLQIDGVQLERDTVMHDYVENFNYLFIGFNKNDNREDPPFALIDTRDKYSIKYDNGKYGGISSINSAYYDENNELFFVDNKNVYSLTFLNEVDQYDRYTIINLFEKNNFKTNIEKFETVSKFNNKLYFGGVIKNNVVSFKVLDNDIHDIVFGSSTSQQSINELLGDIKLIMPTSGTDNMLAEFNRTEDCYEGTATAYGTYLPGQNYIIDVIIDSILEITVTIISPELNQGPWTLNNIYEQINSYYNSSEGPEVKRIEWLNPTGELPAVGELDWRKPVSNTSIIDGFYSIGEANMTSHIRGNVHRMYIQDGNTESFYIIRGSQIFKSKFDPNIIKNTLGNFISYTPMILDSNYNLTKYYKRYNEEIIFNDDTYNRDWIQLPVSINTKILNGSVRIKTNEFSEVGFSENIDYIIDYENSTIIRNNVENNLINSDFTFHSSVVLNQPNNWNYNISGDANLSKFVVDSDNEDNEITESAKFYSYAAGSNTSAIVNQIFSPTMGLNSGETYTFSIYIKSYKSVMNDIRITELMTGEEDNFTITTQSSNTFDISELNNNIGEWTRFSVSHTISGTPEKLRVEIQSDSSYELIIANAQLERNLIMTPWIKELQVSRIDPDAHVWIDFKEYNILDVNVDYQIDLNDNNLIINNEPIIGESYYLEYKYEKIFNAYDFGDIIPKTQESYDSNDDFFLYYNEGRIWAINQMFAMLSLDNEDPLTISYDYHYPRVDQVKIRNTPDVYGNYIYIVKGIPHENNPYKPNDVGTGYGIDGETQKYYNSVSIHEIEDEINNEVLYEMNIVRSDYKKNDIYDRRIYIDARFNTAFNISLFPETIAYFPFVKDFNSTNGLSPLNFVQRSKIIPIIKYYSIIQFEEVGAWHEGYQVQLRNKSSGYSPSTSIYVDPITGNDENDGETVATALKTVGKAVDTVFYISENNRRDNIVIIKAVTISENVDINLPFKINIFASTYCKWKGAIRNLTPIGIEGIWFQNSELYPYSTLDLYYITLENSSINCSNPQDITTYNSEMLNCHNSILRVNEKLFPSPFSHPYLVQPSRDDGVAETPASIASDDEESIAPGDDYSLSTSTSGQFKFYNCLIYGATDHIVDFDPSLDWSGSFLFNHCTIANNRNLFATSKYGLEIIYNNSILFNNREVRDPDSKMFDSNSNINFDTCFIDFPSEGTNSDPINWNYKPGNLVGRETCIGLTEISNPYFLSDADYHLKSIARGSDTDSIALDSANNGIDLGCYNESREQTEKNIPKKLRNYVASLDEGIMYPITLNSEKITITLEFKPTSQVANAGVIFDTRSSWDDEDYIILAYNQNDNDVLDIGNNQSDPTQPYRFRVLVKNKETLYSVISPIEIETDEDFKIWQKISFTINYEKILNIKSGFAEKDKQQNIITIYHNDSTSIESFIKYDLNRDSEGDVLSGRGGEGTNSWDFNNICQFITLGSDYSGINKMTGYYSELRIDNKFIDRKQFELWNEKKVPFNDPLSYVNQAPLTKSFDTRTLTEYWSLKDQYGVGAKGSKFKEETNKRIIDDNREKTWFLGRPINNLIQDSGFDNHHNASIMSVSEITFDIPIELNHDWIINTVGSVKATDNAGITLDIINPLTLGYTQLSGYQELGLTGSVITADTSLSLNTDYSINIDIDGEGIVEYNFTTPVFEEEAEITFPADISQSLSGKYWTVSSLTTDYYVWYNMLQSAEFSGYQELGLSGKLGTTSAGLVEGTNYYWKTSTNGGATVEYNIQSIPNISAINEVAELTFDYDLDNLNYDGLFFDIFNGSILTRIWFNVDGASTAPTNGGGSLQVIDISSSDSEDDIALSVDTAINFGYTEFSSTVVNNVLTITNTVGGVNDDIISSGAISSIVLIQGVDEIPVDTTISDLISLINIEMTGLSSQLIDGDIRFTSDLLGSSSSIALSGTSGLSLFTALSSMIKPAVPGQDNIYSTDPAPASRTGIQIDIVEDESAVNVATFTKNAIDINSDFDAEIILNNEILITTLGDVQDISDVDAGISVSTITQGINIRFNHLIDLLNTEVPTTTWTLINGDLRCSSSSITSVSTISLSAGTTNLDLLAKLSAAVEVPVEGYEKVIINSIGELRSTLNNSFSLLNSKIDFKIIGDKLELFTKDVNASGINVLFGPDDGNDLNSDHLAVEFNNKNSSGTTSNNNWDISGLEFANEDDSVYTSNFVSRYSKKSLFIDKQTKSSVISVTIKNPLTVSIGESYWVSFNVYYEGGKINKDEVRFYLNEQPGNPTAGDLYDFDEIELGYGNWFVLKKLIVPTTNSLIIGIEIEKEAYSMYINGVQLEKNYFVSPYVEDANDNNGLIVLNKSLLDKERGVIHIRMKPLFDFYEPRENDLEHPPKIIFESLGIDNETGDPDLNLGFRIKYYFDELKNRGIVEYSINGSGANWKLETVETFWNQWHTIAIVYDFTTNRHIFWFDYFTNVFDTILENDFELTDLYIGHGFPETSRWYEGFSADIEVKDVIITDFPISDSELLNWIQTYEFFNISQVNSTINEMQEVLNSQNIAISELSSIDVLNRLNEIEEDITSVQSGQSLQDSDIILNKNELVDHSARVLDLETIVGDSSPLSGLVGTTTTLEADISDIKGNWPPNNPLSANLTNLRDDVDSVNDLINDEIIDSVERDDVIMNSIQSTITPSGASVIGVDSTSGMFTGVNLEEAIQEISGVGRTIENIKGNFDQIALNIINIGNNTNLLSNFSSTLPYVLDGNKYPSAWSTTIAENAGYNIFDNRESLNLIMTSIVDGNSGADNVSATSISFGTSTTVQGILEEIGDELIIIGGSSTLNTSYENGSSIIVDVTDVEWNLDPTRAFKIIDTVDTNKFVISEGNMTDSISVNTSGGFEITANNDSFISVVDSDLRIGTETSGNLTLQSVDAVFTTSSFLPSNTESVSLGTLSNKWAALYAQVGYFDASTIFLGEFNSIRVDSGKIQISNDDGIIYSDLIDKVTLETPGNVTLDWSDLGNVPNVFAPDLHTHVRAEITDFTHEHDVLYYTKNEMNTGAMDGRYFNETELGTDTGASFIGYNDLNTEIGVTNIQDAIESIYLNQADNSKFEGVVVNTEWIVDGELYYVDITHDLKTTDIVALIRNSATNQIVGVDEIERLNINTIRLYVSDNTLDLDVMVIGTPEQYSIIINNWTADGDDFYRNIIHEIDTRNLMVSAFKVSTGEMIEFDEIEFVDNATIKINSTSNDVTNVFIMKSAKNPLVKNIEAWEGPVDGFYTSTIDIETAFDAIYNTFDPVTGQTIKVESLVISDGKLIIKKTTNDLLRVVILK